MPIPSYRTRQPLLHVPPEISFEFAGWVGDRIRANENNWLIPAPSVNPGMIGMFRNRDRLTWAPAAWIGEYAGKYLISAVQSLRLTRNPSLAAVVETFVSGLLDPHVPDHSLGLPLPWDLWGQYHVMLGLLHWYAYSGDSAALAACVGAADLAYSRYFDAPCRMMDPDPDHPEVNMAIIHVLTLLFAWTGDARYREFAYKIADGWATCDIALNYLQDARAGVPFWNGKGRRWEGLPSIQALAELSYIIPDSDTAQIYFAAFNKVWQDLHDSERHCTGGFTSSETTTGDHCNPGFIETCGTVAWMALTIDKALMSLDNTDAADDLELALFNAVLGAQTPDGRLWTYHTPMGGITMDDFADGSSDSGVFMQCQSGYRLPATYNLSGQSDCSYPPFAGGNKLPLLGSYPQLSCCAANGPRGIGCLSEWAVVRSERTLVINYYGPGYFTVATPSGAPLRVTQRTAYPADGVIDIVLDLPAPEIFTIALRIPGWSTRSRVELNGGTLDSSAGRYCQIFREWRSDDTVRITMDMNVAKKTGTPRANGLKVAYYGPLLLALDSIDNPGAISSPPSLSSLPVAVSLNPDHLVRVDFAHAGVSVPLRPFAFAGQSPGGALPPRPNPAVPWRFLRSQAVDETNGASVIAPHIDLLTDGTIRGYSHPNESRWGFDGDILAFYAADGSPSTRFTYRMDKNGKQLLIGTFLFDPSIHHVLSEIDFSITGHFWQFRSRSTSPPPGNDPDLRAKVLLRVVQLNLGGTFSVPTHPNETRWGMEGDALVFYGADGSASTRFTEIQMLNGRTLRSGQFLYDGEITHELVQIDPDFTKTIWMFRREGRKDSLTNELQLLPDGTIDGYRHPNERKWTRGLTPWSIQFLNDRNEVTTLFEAGNLTVNKNGAMQITGTLIGTSITHTLIESAPGWVFGSRYLSWLPYEPGGPVRR